MANFDQIFVNNRYEIPVQERDYIFSILLQLHFLHTEAVVQRCSVKKGVLKLLQNSQENNCARISFILKLQASHLQLY